ncbi:MAG: UPF0179 family protein [Vulcanisaeta sp. AZ3]|jgi:uncharacterized protein (UPF0179 family)
MDYGKRITTLIGKEQAVIGKTFRLYSIPDECKKCKLYSICVARLRLGRVYRIVEVKHVGLPQPSKCLLTGEDMVPIVIEEMPITIPIPIKSFMEGITLTYIKPKVNCDELKRYIPSEQVIKDGTKVKVIREVGRVRCGDGDYILSEVMPLD